MIKMDDKNFNEVKKAYNKLKYLIDKNKIKLYTAGGAIPYLINGDDSNRMHHDLDNICKNSDISSLRDMFKNAGLYDEKLDSKTYSADGKDYGFEVNINGVKTGVYPFAYSSERKMIIQRSYDSKSHTCKEKEVTCEDLSDYIMTYKGSDGRKYDAMSLEMIRFTKSLAGREKDKKDIEEIDKIGYRKDVYDRLKPFKETKNIKAEYLEGKDNKRNLEDIRKEKEELISFKTEVLGMSKADNKEKEEEKTYKKKNKSNGFISILEILISLCVVGSIIPTIISILINK